MNESLRKLSDEEANAVNALFNNLSLDDEDDDTEDLGNDDNVVESSTPVDIQEDTDQDFSDLFSDFN